MKKCGFTLVEMLAVLVLVGALAVISVPSILNYINQNKGEISETTEKLIYTGVDLYVDNNGSIYKKGLLQQNCIILRNVVEANYLQEPIIDSISGTEIDLNKYVKLNYYYDEFLEKNKIKYEIVDECVEKKYVCAATSDSNLIADNYEYGDEYVCDMGDGVERRFHLLQYSEDIGGASLIMDRNLGTPIIWGSVDSMAPQNSLSLLLSLTEDWDANGIIGVNLPSAYQIAAVQGKSFEQNSMNVPKWLYQNLDSDSNSETPGGYWTSEVNESDLREAWVVQGVGLYPNFKTPYPPDSPSIYLGPNEQYYNIDIGIRPVVIIDQNEIYMGGNYEN